MFGNLVVLPTLKFIHSWTNFLIPFSRKEGWKGRVRESNPNPHDFLISPTFNPSFFGKRSYCSIIRNSGILMVHSYYNGEDTGVIFV